MAPPPLPSGHLWSVAILASALVVALAAERFSADPRGPGVRVRGAEDFGDIAGFVAPMGAAAALSRFETQVRVDPLEGDDGSRIASFPVARAGGTPTVITSGSASGRPSRQLSAILIADNRPLAVIDDQVVGVGARLKDGARISSIQGDRVWVVETNGKWRMLTLAAGRP